MSTLIYGNIYCKRESKIPVSELAQAAVRFCLDNTIGIHFLNSLFSKEQDEINISFQLSDNFLMHHCDFFMEPIIYSSGGVPLCDNLLKDIDKIYDLLQLIFSFDFAQKVELRFSFVEVDEDEFQVCHIRLREMKEVLLQKYLENSDIPVVKMVITS